MALEYKNTTPLMIEYVGEYGQDLHGTQSKINIRNNYDDEIELFKGMKRKQSLNSSL